MTPHDLNVIDHTILKTLGITEEQLLSLPQEYQSAFLYYDWQLCNHRDMGNGLKNDTLSDNSDNIEAFKKKVLTLFKKK